MPYMPNMAHTTGRRPDEYDHVLQEIEAGRKTVAEAASECRVEESTIKRNLLKFRDKLQAEKERAIRDSPPIIGTPYMVWMDGAEAWRVAEADGKGGFRGNGWYIMAGHKCHAVAIKTPSRPSKKPMWPGAGRKNARSKQDCKKCAKKM